ncbi:MAG TPA: ABC transporter ATP-binding protein [Bacilli bacterium]|nr:ABC transporter ATP-binding protein [Bacilli bacterium]
MELKNFSKRYGKNKDFAVKDASLVVSGGEIFGFLGPNGAGKSTTIKSIVGIQTITEGSISICGYDVEKQPVMAKRLIGYVPDHYALYEKLTAREYVNYIADIYGVTYEERQMRIPHYVSLFHLEDAFDNQIKTFSHGMKQKVTIIAALVHEPKLWLLDEPLTGLDPDSIYQVKECMRQHAAKGNIVMFSSHIIDVVENLCQKIAVIKKGHLFAPLTIDEVHEQGTLEEYYLKMAIHEETPEQKATKEIA